MNKELMEALDMLEKEKEISKETLFEPFRQGGQYKRGNRQRNM